MNSINFESVSLLVCILIVYVLCFNMVMIHGRVGGSGSGSRSGSGTEPFDEGLCKFIASKITRGILDATLVMFGSIK